MKKWRICGRCTTEDEYIKANGVRTGGEENLNGQQYLRFLGKLASELVKLTLAIWLI